MKLHRNVIAAAFALSLCGISTVRADEPAPADKPVTATNAAERSKELKANAEKRMQEAKVHIPEEKNVRPAGIRAAVGEEIAWAEIPETARKSLEGILGDARPEKATKTRVARTVVYEARETTGQLRGGRVSEDGTVLEAGAKAGELPPGVTAFVAEQLKGQAGDVRKVTMTYYEVDTGKQGRASTLRLTGAGTPLQLGGGGGIAATRIGAAADKANELPEKLKNDPNFVDRPGANGKPQKPEGKMEKPNLKKLELKNEPKAQPAKP